MIVVMGATGHTGKKIAEALLKGGQRVRALGRSEGRLAEFKISGAEALAGLASDAAFLTKAFRGADAVYTLLPTDRQSPDYLAQQQQEGEAIVKAIREAGVRYVIALSSLGADLSRGTGLIAGLHAHEERLKRLEQANVLFRRPASFFENFYDALAPIKQEGIIADSVAPYIAVSMVATRDIADVAARALVHAGLSESFAGLYVEMTNAFNEGKLGPRDGRKPENTTPTRFEDLAGELASASRAM